MPTRKGLLPRIVLEGTGKGIRCALRSKSLALGPIRNNRHPFRILPFNRATD